MGERLLMEQVRVGLIGWPVAHSLSPLLHNAAFQALGMDDWHYELLPTRPEELAQQLQLLAQRGYAGVNVTIPHKEAVLPLVKADALAKCIGAANTIHLPGLSATNTDVSGFLEDLACHEVSVPGTRVAVLGAGGIARAVVYGLSRMGAEVVVVARRPERATQMIADLGAQAVPSTFASLTRHEITLLVNCTPVGMWPHGGACPWPTDVPFPRGVIVYDMVYRPRQTVLMKMAEQCQGRAISGIGTLVRQAALSFSLWTKRSAPYDAMFAACDKAWREDSL